MFCTWLIEAGHWYHTGRTRKRLHEISSFKKDLYVCHFYSMSACVSLFAKALDATVLAEPTSLRSFDRLHLAASLNSIGGPNAVCADYEAIGLHHGCSVLAYSSEDARMLFMEASRLMLHTICPPSRPDMGEHDDCLPLHEVYHTKPMAVVRAANAVTEVHTRARTHTHARTRTHAHTHARNSKARGTVAWFAE